MKDVLGEKGGRLVFAMGKSGVRVNTKIRPESVFPYSLAINLEGGGQCLAGGDVVGFVLLAFRLYLHVHLCCL